MATKPKCSCGRVLNYLHPIIGLQVVKGGPNVCQACYDEVRSTANKFKRRIQRLARGGMTNSQIAERYECSRALVESCTSTMRKR